MIEWYKDKLVFCGIITSGFWTLYWYIFNPAWYSFITVMITMIIIFTLVDIISNKKENEGGG